MGSVNARDLARQTATILDEVERTRRPMLVFRNGKPVAALVALDEDGLEDYVLANAPEFAASFRRADQDARAGRLRTVADVFADLEVQVPAVER
ncbi:MAG: type II toxin-antitoxin system prevent-host-death family antitoxin [Candidatus Dormibacteria bacterium]